MRHLFIITADVRKSLRKQILKKIVFSQAVSFKKLLFIDTSRGARIFFENVTTLRQMLDHKFLYISLWFEIHLHISQMIALYLTEGNSLSKVCFEKFVTFFQVCWVLEILTSIFLKVGNKIVVMFFKKKLPITF